MLFGESLTCNNISCCNLYEGNQITCSFKNSDCRYLSQNFTPETSIELSNQTFLQFEDLTYFKWYHQNFKFSHVIYCLNQVLVNIRDGDLFWHNFCSFVRSFVHLNYACPLSLRLVCSGRYAIYLLHYITCRKLWYYWHQFCAEYRVSENSKTRIRCKLRHFNILFLSGLSVIFEEPIYSFCFLQTNLPIFRVKESCVRRRYSDFEWLRGELERDSKVCMLKFLG